MDQVNETAIQILGVKVHPLTVEQLHEHIGRYIEQQRHALVLNVNVNCLNLAHDRPWLKDLLNSAALVFCDGAGVILGARLLGHRLPMRITYADWIWQLAAFAAEHRFSMFFLGGQAGVAADAAAQLLQRFPELQIVGTHHGYFGKNTGGQENQAVVQAINAADPDILVVAFGMPLQEEWLMHNWDSIRARVALTGGAVFDYISGALQRSPGWMNDHGLEWLGRLLIEPTRLWRRYLLGNPIFLARVLRQRYLGPER